MILRTLILDSNSSSEFVYGMKKRAYGNLTRVYIYGFTTIMLYMDKIFRPDYCDWLL
jgi:hypothetical protein